MEELGDWTVHEYFFKVLGKGKASKGDPENINA